MLDPLLLIHYFSHPLFSASYFHHHANSLPLFSTSQFYQYHFTNQIPLLCARVRSEVQTGDQISMVFLLFCLSLKAALSQQQQHSSRLAVDSEFNYSLLFIYCCHCYRMYRICEVINVWDSIVHCRQTSSEKVKKYIFLIVLQFNYCGLKKDNL